MKYAVLASLLLPFSVLAQSPNCEFGFTAETFGFSICCESFIEGSGHGSVYDLMRNFEDIEVKGQKGPVQVSGSIRHFVVLDQRPLADRMAFYGTDYSAQFAGVPSDSTFKLGSVDAFSQRITQETTAGVMTLEKLMLQQGSDLILIEHLFPAQGCVKQWERELQTLQFNGRPAAREQDAHLRAFIETFQLSLADTSKLNALCMTMDDMELMSESVGEGFPKRDSEEWEYMEQLLNGYKTTLAQDAKRLRSAPWKTHDVQPVIQVTDHMDLTLFVLAYAWWDDRGRQTSPMIALAPMEAGLKIFRAK